MADETVTDLSDRILTASMRARSIRALMFMGEARHTCDTNDELSSARVLLSDLIEEFEGLSEAAETEKVRIKHGDEFACVTTREQ